MTTDALPQLERTRLLAILRSDSGEHLRDVAETLIASGIRCLEITAPTPGADEVIADLARRDGIEVGMGTVMGTDDVARAARAGARFIVCPHTDVDVVRSARDAGMQAFPGVFTPTETVRAVRAGASAVKLFPADALGPGFVSALVRGPLPELKIVPTGGVQLADVADWRAAGAWAVAVASPLIGDALRGGDREALAQRCRAFVARAGGVG